MYDQFTYGYLSFALGPNGNTLYYLTGGPLSDNGRRVTGSKNDTVGSGGKEDLHLVTYEIPTARYADHGAIFFPDGQRPSLVNSIAVAKDGSVYSLAGVAQKGHVRVDLFRIQPQ